MRQFMILMYYSSGGRELDIYCLYNLRDVCFVCKLQLQGCSRINENSWELEVVLCRVNSKGRICKFRLN